MHRETPIKHKRAHHWSILILILILLLLYVGGYGFARVSEVLVHTNGIPAFELTGQSHAVEAARAYSHPNRHKAGQVARFVFYPIVLIEQVYWNWK
jgi:hypothetical protein